ncbi:MAG: OsmC family protein [bacterium]
MRSLVRWKSPMKFEAVSGSGHTVLMDGPPDHGGEDSGPRPMEMLLMGMGGCASFDVVHILKRSRQQVIACEAEIVAERADEEPKVFTRIHLHFVVTGKDLSEKKVAKAIELSAEKYCSASIMLGKTAVITHDFKIIGAPAPGSLE